MYTVSVYKLHLIGPSVAFDYADWLPDRQVSSSPAYKVGLYVTSWHAAGATPRLAEHAGKSARYF